MGPRHSPEEAAEATPVRLDKASLERWEDLANRHDDGTCHVPTLFILYVYTTPDIDH